MHNAVVLGKGKCGELGKCISEARIGREVARAGRRGEVVDTLRGNAPGGEGSEPSGGKGVGIQREERIGGLDLDEGVVQGEDAGEVVEVGDERRPDCILRRLAAEEARDSQGQTGWRNMPLSEGTALLRPVCVMAAAAGGMLLASSRRYVTGKMEEKGVGMQGAKGFSLIGIIKYTILMRW